MSLFFHELAHLSSSLLVVYLVWKIYLHGKKDNHKAIFFVSISAIMGGLFIDLDHMIDYYLAFKLNFNLNYFLKGYEFLKTGRIIIPFHSFELVIILLAIVFIINDKLSKALILAFALALFFHLIIDVNVNKLPVKSYFLLYRVKQNFQLKKLVTPNHYQKYLNQKKKVKFN